MERDHRLAPPRGSGIVVGGLLAALLVAGAPGHAEADDPEAAQSPFLCTTEVQGLGQPIVDNDERRGTPVYPQDADGQPDRSQDPVGWSERCQVEPVVTYHYRTETGALQDVPEGATEPPEDVAWLDVDAMVGSEDMTLDGAEQIPFVLRLERGSLPGHRFLYSIAMLVPFEEVTGDLAPGEDHWNRRLLYSFDGGVGIGHSQGGLSTSSGTFDAAMRLGHAVVYSSGTATTLHYDLLLGGRTATEAKDTFVARHGEPRYTVGIGGSGGGIQQYVYGQNQPDLLDAAIPLYSYPDMTTQTIHTGDCELLEHYMDVTAADNERWRDWDQRRIVQGLNSIHGFASSWQQRTGADGSTECVEGWRGLTPLAMNPTFGFASGMDAVLEMFLDEILQKLFAGQPPVPDDFPDIGRLLRVDPDPQRWVEWTHWDDVREVYGTDPGTGFARVPWDNVGVQYGLRALADGDLTAEEFVDLNARVGAWGEPEDARPESCGLVDVMLGGDLTLLAEAIGMCEGADLDPYSTRQMRLSDDDAPAPRREGDVAAMHGAYASGLVFDGRLPRTIPVIDARHYLEHELDMHNVHQSFAVRERIARAQGHHDNHLVWFQDARPSINPVATAELLQHGFRVMDEWLANLDAEPAGDVAAARPAAAVDTCWDTDGTLIASGDDVWSGAVELITSGVGDWTDQAPGAVEGVEVGDCSAQFPLYSTSRIVAGGPVTGDVYKCHTMPVRTAAAEGLYGVWEPGDEDLVRLEEIHPDGVCDYGLPDRGRPDLEVPDAPEVRAVGGGLLVSGTEPGAEIQLRRAGEVEDTGTANPAGRLVFPRLAPGEVVVAQTVAGQRSLLSQPVTVEAPGRGRDAG